MELGSVKPEEARGVLAWDRLPPMCFGFFDGEMPVQITRGKLGFTPVSPKLDPDDANKELKITREQAMAMQAGAIHGWNHPTSDPLY